MGNLPSSAINSRHLFQWSFPVNESCFSSTVHTFFSTTSRHPACSSDRFRSGPLSWPSRSKSSILATTASTCLRSDTGFRRGFHPFIILYSVVPVSPNFLSIIKFMLICKLTADTQHIMPNSECKISWFINIQLIPISVASVCKIWGKILAFF